jgi:hypothetical protein
MKKIQLPRHTEGRVLGAIFTVHCDCMHWATQYAGALKETLEEIDYVYSEEVESSGGTSSAYPSWAPNYNTGKNIWEETEPIIATQTVYHSREYPSKLVLQEVRNPRYNDSWMVSRWNSQSS